MFPELQVLNHSTNYPAGIALITLDKKRCTESIQTFKMNARLTNVSASILNTYITFFSKRFAKICLESRDDDDDDDDDDEDEEEEEEETSVFMYMY